MRQDSNLLSLAAAAGAGALFMYYLDAKNGARRRALVRDKVVSAGRDAAHRAQTSGKHATDRMKGIAARLRRAGEAESDEQLQQRIRARLGHAVRHLKSLQIEVDRGHVCLKGHVLAHDLDRVLAEVKAIPGVKALRSELVGHESEQSIEQAAEQPLAPHPTPPAHDSWNEQGV